jgi:hypothetical protein
MYSMVFIPYLPITPFNNLKVSACAADRRRAVSLVQRDGKDIAWQIIQGFV